MKKHAESRQTIEVIRQYIERSISNDEWAPGSRLPTERALAEEFGVARNAVRRALSMLEGSGQIVRKVGQGTFVADNPGVVIIQPQHDSRKISPEDIMEVRLLIEPMIASLVVARATQNDLDEMAEIAGKCNESSNMATFEYWDGKLHNAIAHASKNQYLIELVEGLHAVRRETSWGQLKRRGESEERRAIYQTEHHDIISALLDRNAEQAEKAIRAHLLHVRWNLFGR
ncbi:MAG: FadR family transcriptional regulator [Rhizobiales bacterium]|nr:FadR family transcriptional regulator [Hyphomicrobiales bacterium]